MTVAVSTSCTPVMGSNTARTALTKTSAPTVRKLGLCYLKRKARMETSTTSPLGISLVDSSRKSVTHPADLPNLRQPVAQTEETADGSLPRDEPKKTLDGSKSTPPQSSARVETQVSQGQVAFVLNIHGSETKSGRNCCSEHMVGFTSPSIPFTSPVPVWIFATTIGSAIWVSLVQRPF